MAYFQHLYNVGDVDEIAASGLTALHLMTWGGTRYLQATGTEAGQVFTWDLTSGYAVLARNDVLMNAAGLSASVEIMAAPGLEQQSTEWIWIYGIGGQGAGAYTVGSEGRLVEELRLDGGQSTVTDLMTGQVGDQMFALTTTRSSNSVDFGILMHRNRPY